MALKLTHLVLAVFFTTVALTRGQQAVSSITQSRLFTNSPTPASISVDANGTALPESEEPSSGDGSFGAQILLKSQPRPRSFALFGSVSAFHTSNVDLTPHGRRGDVFVAANVAAAWRPTITQSLLADISAGISAFRYERARELDFEKLSAGAGLNWLVPRTPGIVAFARYDFAELLKSGGKELLQDHELAIGLHRSFAFGRSHFLTAGITGVLGKSRPRSEERDQAAIHAAYHLQITRSLEADLLYRYAAQFYDTGGRVDHNQALSFSLGFYPARWLRVDGSVSAARNDSNQSAFEYDVLSLGGGIKFDLRF